MLINIFAPTIKTKSAVSMFSFLKVTCPINSLLFKKSQIVLVESLVINEKVEMDKCLAITVAIIFGVSLIVSGLPVDNVDNVETTTLTPDDNGTHKEL